MRRLLSYAKPYWVLVLGALVSLVVSTGGDLLLPIVIRTAVDDHLIGLYTRIPTSFMDNAELAYVDNTEAMAIGEATFIPDDRLVALSGVQRGRLVESGILEERGYYVFPYELELAAMLSAGQPPILPESGEVDGKMYAAIAAEVLDSLPNQIRAEIRREDLAGLRRTTVVFFILLASVLVFTFTELYLMALTGQGAMKDMRLELFEHTLRQKLGYLSNHAVGKLVTRVTNDVETVNQLFTQVLANLLRNVALMLGSLSVLMFLNWRLGLVTLATLPPVLLTTLFFRKRAREAFRRVRVWVSRVNAFLSEHLSGMTIVQLFVRETRVAEEFDERNEELKKANLSETYVFAVFRPLVDLFSSVSIAVILYFGARFLLGGLVSLGVLIAFINLIRRFFRPIMQISEQFTILQSAMAGGERVFEMLDGDDRIPDTGSHAPMRVSGTLEFHEVCFAYKEGEPVIRNLSFAISAGETVAVVGYTGAGKTTIANLISRLWDIDSGSILLDGVDIRQFPLTELRTLVQPIQQDVFLFSDSIRANITLGLDLDDERIEEVAKMAQADGFVHRLPGGFASSLTEGATNISTGERQLLSFARILAHDPRIIVMDEATANIDTETERLIQLAVETLMEKRTALVIAHRLSTIKNADRIIVLAKGELIEEGTHDELIRLGGTYYDLYRLQYQQTL